MEYFEKDIGMYRAIVTFDGANFDLSVHGLCAVPLFFLQEFDLEETRVRNRKVLEEFFNDIQLDFSSEWKSRILDKQSFFLAMIKLI